MPTWPATLPEFVLEAGYGEQLEDTTRETQMDAGPPKVRRRFTKGYRLYSVAIEMDPDVADDFTTFYEDTCKGGAIPFTWVHPRTQEPQDFYFAKPVPRISVRGSGNVVRASFTLRST